MDQAKLEQALAVYDRAIEAVEKAEDNLQLALQQVRKFAEKPTFCVQGQHYQLRERKGRIYMCVLEGPPKGRPRKSKAEKEAARNAETAAGAQALDNALEAAPVPTEPAAPPAPVETEETVATTEEVTITSASSTPPPQE